MKKRKRTGDQIEVVIIGGVEGPSVYIGGHRIAGPKPWGGGPVLHKWDVPLSDIKKAIKRSDP